MFIIYILSFGLLALINAYIVFKFKITSYIGLGAFYFLTVLMPSPFIYYKLGEAYLSYATYNNMIHVLCMTVFFSTFLLFEKIFNNRLVSNRGEFIYRLPAIGWLKLFSNCCMGIGAASVFSGYILAEHSLIDVIVSNIAEVYVSEKSAFGGFLDQGLVLFNIGVVFRIVLSDRFSSKILFILLLTLFHMAFSFSRGGLLPVLILFFILQKLISHSRGNGEKSNRARVLFFGIFIFVAAAVAGGVATIKRAAEGAYVLDSNTVVASFISRLEDRFTDENNSLYVGYGNILYRTTFEDISLKKGDVISYSFFSNIPKFIYKDKPVHPMRGTNYFVYTDRPSVNPLDVSAFGLVGSAYYDFGLASGIFYLVLFSLFLNISVLLLRRLKYNFVFYIGLLCFDGPQNFIHAGIISVVGNVIYTVLFISVAILAVDIVRMFSSLKRLVMKRAVYA